MKKSDTSDAASAAGESPIRTMLEAREYEILSAHAAKASESRGRQMAEFEDPYRTAYQRDRDRILHTKAFRRLKQKTQVFLSPEGDHFRTRLTHTLEVTQIARTVARALCLNEDLTEAIGTGHDLGHTPFGHAGESVLNEAVAGGFRHFEQSLRVVDKLEKRGECHGLNLTWEVRDGIRYHSQGKALLRGLPCPGPNTLEGAVVSISDAIAYINHDIDDALRAGIIQLDDLPRDAIAALGERTSERIDRMVVGLIEGSQDGQVGILPEILEPMNALRDYLYSQLYPCDAIDGEIRKAKKMLRELFDYLLENPTPDLLAADGEDNLERRVVDYIAGMTDDYAIRLYQKIFMPLHYH